VFQNRGKLFGAQYRTLPIRLLVNIDRRGRRVLPIFSFVAVRLLVGLRMESLLRRILLARCLYTREDPNS
jgi:hypothetical protein